MKVELNPVTEYQENQCNLFSKFSVFSSLDEYKKRNQLDKEKIINDIYNGKIAEFMVYNFLITRNKKPSSPDLNIYEKYDKSYNADLITDNANIHVKSHNVNGNFPVSWVFQKRDPLLTSTKENDYLALVVMNKDVNYMYLKNVLEVEFKEPVKESLRDTKSCVYEIDFKKNNK
jgi:hypothetical protein